MTHGVHQRRADPPRLHALIGHYARLLADVQQLRIAAQMRAGAMRREEIPDAWALPMDTVTRDLLALERAADRQLISLVEQHPLADWVARTPGVGLHGVGRLLGVTGPLERFPSPAHLWAFLGLAVVDGRAPRRSPAWSRYGRVVAYRLALAAVFHGRGPYREAYDVKKAEYLAREPQGPSACQFGQIHATRAGQVLACRPAHVHNAAVRYASKRLVRDLWFANRRADDQKSGAQSLVDRVSQ